MPEELNERPVWNCSAFLGFGEARPERKRALGDEASWSLLHDANQEQSLSASDTLMNWHRAHRVHLCRHQCAAMLQEDQPRPPKLPDSPAAQSPISVVGPQCPRTAVSSHLDTLVAIAFGHSGISVDGADANIEKRAKAIMVCAHARGHSVRW